MFENTTSSIVFIVTGNSNTPDFGKRAIGQAAMSNSFDIYNNKFNFNIEVYLSELYTNLCCSFNTYPLYPSANFI